MIKLTKDKIIYSNHYNPECDEYVEKELPHLDACLDEVVELSDDFTLEDFFTYIERDKEYYSLVFSSHLGHHLLQPYIDEIKKPNPKKDSEIDYLELRRYGEYWSWGDIDLFVDFSGVSEKTDTGYALEFTPLNELKHLPLRLNKDFSVSEIRTPSRIVMYFVRLLKKIGVSLRKWDNPYEHVYIKGKVEFTVYELISTILSEISLVGSPRERDTILSEIEEDIDEMMSEYGDLDSED